MPRVKTLLGDGYQFGIKLSYAVTGLYYYPTDVSAGSDSISLSDDYKGTVDRSGKIIWKIYIWEAILYAGEISGLSNHLRG